MGQTLRIELEDEFFLGLNKNPLELTNEIRLAAAVKWYELGKISQEKAAQLAGLSREEFIFSLPGFSVSPFQETETEISSALMD